MVSRLLVLSVLSCLASHVAAQQQPTALLVRWQPGSPDSDVPLIDPATAWIA